MYKSKQIIVVGVEDTRSGNIYVVNGINVATTGDLLHMDPRLVAIRAHNHARPQAVPAEPKGLAWIRRSEGGVVVPLVKEGSYWYAYWPSGKSGGEYWETWNIFMHLKVGLTREELK